MRERRRNASDSLCSCGTRCAVQTFRHKCYLWLQATLLMIIIAGWVSAEPAVNISAWRDSKCVRRAAPPSLTLHSSSSFTSAVDLYPHYNRSELNLLGLSGRFVMFLNFKHILAHQAATLIWTNLPWMLITEPARFSIFFLFFFFLFVSPAVKVIHFNLTFNGLQ